MDYVLAYSLSLALLRVVLSAEEHRVGYYWQQMRKMIPSVDNAQRRRIGITLVF